MLFQGAPGTFRVAGTQQLALIVILCQNPGFDTKRLKNHVRTLSIQKNVGPLNGVSNAESRINLPSP